MPRALVDTSVLFAAGYRRDGAHDEALPILTGIDSADLPEAVIVDHVLAETLNGLTTHAGHSAAVDFFDRLEENARIHIDSLTSDGFATAKGLFRQYEQFSFVDAAVVAYIQAEGLGYLYAFDDDFDAAADVDRLDTATNPYRPG
ncbi:PIN domain-containing protein [Halorubrum ezzemoulense]|jgi:predicted nucleic acid-binding protein|uniref:PIN domain-containing protein n=1 Tax=Halorubrum ezzemoulense TaxID=337243 RepID=UPI00232F2E7B|nr:PIN domain-containing protein [Halorubrum ezzemoulense]MDB2272280.1 PIN domain-containing protein [Halorubrum ezzemoulense]MDB9250656.1 PIN domain-containing protein [Halorubrum ezzemoulense]MDB9260747.1 PIN domain-containing protein [Halorubrum ezzemoulense]MDB9264174.1 PIN domain-containing protein [Halorubrum ezzemoulense]MDB9267646.1 PIN domain-containing protein [Halorubrum ezzemoulense]